MRNRVSGSALITSLMILSSILLAMLIYKSEWIGSEKVTQSFYADYLSDKLALIEKLNEDEQSVCEKEKREEIVIRLNKMVYRYSCERKTLFLKPKPTREKFIAVDKVENWLDIDNYRHKITFIRTLSELPPSSENNPQVVMTLNDIDERLSQDFYGIVITPHYFNFTDKKIFGTIYSENSRNDPNRRNLSYKRTVIDAVEEELSSWSFLANSRNILSNE